MLRTDGVTPMHQTESEWYEMKPGERLRIKASAAGTGGAYVVLEVEADPGTGVRLHVHDNEDEHFVVVEGTLHMAIDGKTRDLPARSSVTVGKGTPHAWMNRTDSLVRFVAIFTPGRIEGMF